MEFQKNGKPNPVVHTSPDCPKSFEIAWPHTKTNYSNQRVLVTERAMMRSFPAVKRQRLIRQETTPARDDPTQQPTMMATLSHETLLVICSFLGAEDVLALSRVSVFLSKTLYESSVLWKQVVALAADPSLSSGGTTAMMEEVVASLSRNKKNVDEAALWRRCALSRTRAREQRLAEEPRDGPPKHCTPFGIPLPDERCRPRPLKEYSFILDIQNTDVFRKGCSIFLENIEEDSDRASLGFEIPRKHHDSHFPWVEDLGEEDPSARVVFLGTVFTVYAVDRSSGKQTKIYHSRKDWATRLWDPPYGSHYLFPEQDCGNTNEPVPYFTTSIEDFRQKESKHGDSNCCDGRPRLVLVLHFRNGNHHRFEDFFLNDMLLFLENGRVYV